MSGYSDYDVVVIGAGPAGSVTSTIIAQAGYRVLMLEKASVCSSPCAGCITSVIPPSNVIQSKITRMRTYFPDLTYHDNDVYGFVVDRRLFDTMLVSEAMEAGVEVRWNSPLNSIRSNFIEYKGGKVKGRVIIGADGVFSRTARFLGLKKQKIAICAQYHLKGIKVLSQTGEIYFNTKYAPGGYAWVYPTGKDSAKVGIGTTCLTSPRRYLDRFIRSLAGRFKGEITEYITGALPVGALREKLCYGNILLVGDSAGMAHPITGAGINNAMLAGEIAGRTIIDALERNDLTILNEYEIKVRKLFKSLTKALEKRKRLDACVSNQELQKHLPELWVGFNHYWL